MTAALEGEAKMDAVLKVQGCSWPRHEGLWDEYRYSSTQS